MGATARIEAAVAQLREIAAGLGAPDAEAAIHMAANEIIAAIPRPGLGDAAPAAAALGAPAAQDASQVYVSAPAAGAIALVVGLAGIGAGYLVRGKLDEGKRKRLQAHELEDPSEDENGE